MLNFNTGAKCFKIFFTVCSCRKQEYKKKAGAGIFYFYLFYLFSIYLIQTPVHNRKKNTPTKKQNKIKQQKLHRMIQIQKFKN